MYVVAAVQVELVVYTDAQRRDQTATNTVPSAGAVDYLVLALKYDIVPVLLSLPAIA